MCAVVQVLDWARGLTCPLPWEAPLAQAGKSFKFTLGIDLP